MFLIAPALIVNEDFSDDQFHPSTSLEPARLKSKTDEPGVIATV